ncbi:MAG TPA: PPA1309 family protein [Jatrophihabitans sp.]|jgi:hypothetical protein
MSEFSANPLEVAAVEVEAFVSAAGWDQRPALFALVRAVEFARDDPAAAAQLGLPEAPDDALTPIEQDELPEGDLDELLGHIGWPESIAGCALAQEIVILPPSAEAELDDADPGGSAAVAARHPERREARLVVAVHRDGSSAAVLRLRPATDGDAEEDLLVGPDLAPNLVTALLATLED